MASGRDEWYQKLSSRRVDLVGDYAGTELFLIEGDALLLEAFSDHHLDFHGHGFQLLHAAYIVELLLKKLLDRKCHFEIVFFDDHEQLSIPADTDPEDAHKFILARAAIIRHLNKNAAAKFAVRHFVSITQPTFLQYLQDAGVYFVMAHDGARCNDQVKAAFRYALRWWISHGWNVALLNTVELQDTKAMTVVMEGRRHVGELDEPPTIMRAEPTSLLDLTALDITKVYQCCEAHGIVPSERDLVTLACGSLLLQSGMLQADDIETLLLHAVALRHISLAERRLELANELLANAEQSLGLLRTFTQSLVQLLPNIEPAKGLDNYHLSCDVADLVDGRMLATLGATREGTPIHMPAVALADLQAFRLVVSDLAQSQLSTSSPPRVTTHDVAEGDHSDYATTRAEGSFPVLPFVHPVLDRHLAPVHLDVDPEGDPKLSLTEHRIFKELSHWHNAKRPLTAKGSQVQALDWKARRRNDRFMAEMIKYSASLTNAAGNVLDPETIIVKTSTASASTKKQSHQAPDKTSNSKAKAGSAGKKVGGRAAALEAAAKVKAGKAETKDAQYYSAWDNAYKDFAKFVEPEERYLRAAKYLQGLGKGAKSVVEAEIQLYQALCLYELYEKGVSAQPHNSKGSSLSAKDNTSVSNEAYVALIWAIALRLRGSNAVIPNNVASALNNILQKLSLPSILEGDSASVGRKFLFKLDSAATNAKKGGTETSRDAQRFQLEYCGPYLDRSFDATPDARVNGFEPDRWQRDVLDTIDAKQSLLVLAPTSAGKTFISFYAMKQVLESSDDGVLVYVAPTKALVNQIAAEVQARFSKNLKHGGRSVWGIHTRDYRINNPTGCQVLVTVPQVLQIMLLAPSNAEKQSSWSNRVSCIIFDEVHSIGQAEDGLIWEQLILLAPCPIIALSATVGNPQALGSWLEATQRSLGNDFVTIHHKTRYSDLRKFNYLPPKEFTFRPLNQPSSINIPGLDGSDAFSFLHPVSSLVNESRGIPEDLSLEARDCLTLYEALHTHQSDGYKVSRDLAPAHALPNVVRKADILKWEHKLKQVLRDWMKHTDSPFAAVLEHLSSVNVSSARKAPGGDNRELRETTLPLLVDLHEKDALPAILFNYDRSQCEDIAQDVLEKLKGSEDEWKSSNGAWKKKIAAWQEWKDIQDKENEKAKKASTKDKKKQRGNEDDGVGKAEQMRNAANQQTTWMATFDPEAPVDGFHFANWKMLLPSEMIEYQKELGYRGVSPWLIQALERGIGVHHAGMNRKYRQVVEMLFRKGFLRVVIATGTLALGINMPCKTVVFSGDSVFLTALNFRQSAGRAGRRGFDVLGNVVFQNIPYDKVCRLLSSRLPDLNGHFPITTSLVLRLFTLLHATNNGNYASRTVNALLSQPRLYLGGEEAKMTVLHHLRFSIDYLRRTSLLGRDGEPLGLAGLVSHLYYTENSGFAFHALLKGGYFHNLCAGIDNNPKRVLLELMLTLSHLFNRLPCKRADEEFVEEIVKHSSSKVFLEPIPKLAESILKQHNDDTLRMYRAYVATYIDQYINEPEHQLPLSHLVIGSKDTRSGTTLSGTLPSVHIRSPFVALSGHGDDFTTIHDLCSTVRGGVFLEENVIPHVTLYPQESDVPLNAYLLDFFKHGSIEELDKANGIRKGNIWFVLNDFSLVLATVIASLENFMKLTPSDADGLDVRGSGDAAEEQAGDSELGDSGYATAENSVDEDGDSEGELSDILASASLDDGKGLLKVLKAFKMLQQEFNAKFKRTWA